MAGDQTAKAPDKAAAAPSAETPAADHRDTTPTTKENVKPQAHEIAPAGTDLTSSHALATQALDLAYRPKVTDGSDKSPDAAGNDKSNQYLTGNVGQTFKQFQDAVIADKQVQEQAKQLIQISGEYDKLQNGNWKGDQVVQDGVHKAQTVDQLKDTLQQEYSEKMQGFPERQKELYDQWVKVVAASDHLKLDGNGSPTDALNNFNGSADGARRRELLKSLGISGSEVTMDQLQAKTAQIDETLKNNATKPALSSDQQTALETQAKQLKELIPLQNVNDGLQFMVHAPSASRFQMAQILNSGELGDKLPPTDQALAAYRLTIEASTMDPTGSIRKSPEYADLLSKSSKNLLAMTQTDGKDNPNMKAMLDNLNTALTTTSKDPTVAEAAFQAATEASKKLDISAFSGDLRNQRDPVAFTQMYAKMLGAESVKESHAKYLLDQGHVDKSLSILTDLSVKSGDLLTRDYTDLNSTAPKGNVAFDKLMQSAVSRPDLPLTPDAFLLNIAQERSKGNNLDNATVLDNINKFQHSMDKVNFDDVKTSVDSMTKLLQDLKTREQSIDKNFTIEAPDRVKMEKQLAIQSISVMNELNKEKTLLFEKEHGKYLSAFGTFLGGDASSAHGQFQEFADKHPEADLKASVKELTSSVKDGQDKLAKIDQDPHLSDEMKDIKKAQAEAELQFSQTRLQQENVLLAERQQSQDLADKTTWWQRNCGWVATVAGIAAGALVAGAVAATVFGSPAAPEAGVAVGIGVTAALGGAAATDLTVGAGAALALGAGATATEATIGTGALIAAGATATEASLATGTALGTTLATEATLGGATAVGLGSEATAAAGLGTLAARFGGAALLKTAVGAATYYGVDTVDPNSWAKFRQAVEIGGISAVIGPGIPAEFSMFAKTGWSGGVVSSALRGGADTMLKGALVGSPLAAVQAWDNYESGMPLTVNAGKVGVNLFVVGMGSGMALSHLAEIPAQFNKLGPLAFLNKYKTPIVLGGAVSGYMGVKMRSDSIEAKRRDAISAITSNVILLPRDVQP